MDGCLLQHGQADYLQTFLSSSSFQSQPVVNKCALFPQISDTLGFWGEGPGQLDVGVPLFCWSVKIFFGFLKLIDIRGKMNLFSFSLFLGGCCWGFAGLLRNPQGPRGQLAVPDVCPGGSAKVFAVSQERRSHEAHTQRDQVGPCQLCSVDP